ncbi:extracellular solute-binding protein [Faecalicatena sp. AGMB00832]|uniref:Extracellular solute-binding protein n=1 Tax=Faecalicatena faecalis TaxID=2726362 RepID=A0ABS6CZA9_9FIRM|nr:MULTISPECIES: extracellular solute-binding protein [Faecalicatena]MBU3874659.1 extracellular solute-binding protein [Faecalicatena faecalis]MCI6464856.1 extracellular solute-binding protein [Faecalicatena sp.]MDY5619942.1 extracellular solute-binding protein [Lachnospiraceae bacterium]
MNKKKWKKGLAVALGASMVLSLAACGNSGKEEKKEAKEDSKEIEIRLTSRWGGEETLSQYFNSKIDEFNKMDNGIKIVADNVTDEQQYFDKLSSQFGAGTQPNVFINYGGTGIKDYIEGGVLLDLEPYFAEDPEWKDSFMPLFTNWQDGDATYGVPVMLYQILLYYNKDILSANNLEAPETIEDLEKVCDALVAAGVTPFQLGEGTNFRAGHLLNNLCYKAYGGDICDKLASREINYDSKEMTDMYAIIKKWNEKGYFGENPVSVDNNGEKAAFLSGKSAFRYDGAWFVGEIPGTDVEGSVDVTAFPYFAGKEDLKTNVQGGSGQGFSITDSGDEKINDAAVEVVKFLTSQDYYAGLEKASNGGIYPVKFESDPETKIDDMTVKVKEIVAEATVFRGDMQEVDPETHMLNTVRTALQGLFVDSTPEACGKEIVSLEEEK